MRNKIIQKLDNYTKKYLNYAKQKTFFTNNRHGEG